MLQFELVPDLTSSLYVFRILYQPRSDILGRDLISSSAGDKILPSSQIYSPQTPNLLEAHYTRYALPAGSPLPAAEFAKLFAFYSYSSLHELYTTVY